MERNMEELNESKIVFFKRLYSFIDYYLKIEYEARCIEWKHTKEFNFVKNVREENTFRNIKSPPFSCFKIGDDVEINVKERTAKEILNDVIQVLIPNKKRRRLGKAMKTVRERDKPNDKFMTPVGLAKIHIDLIDCRKEDVWLDPCRGTGNYYNQFPSQRLWCEIEDGRNFITSRATPTVICGNPPYSKLNEFFDKAVKMDPRVISFLIGNLNTNGKRLELMKNNGYNIARIHYCNVKGWFGHSAIFVWDKMAVEGETTVSWDLNYWVQDKVFHKRLKR